MLLFWSFFIDVIAIINIIIVIIVQVNALLDTLDQVKWYAAGLPC